MPTSSLTAFSAPADAMAQAVLEAAAVDREIARLTAVRASHIERARVAGLARHPVDRSTGGPSWSDAQVAERQLATELSAMLRVSETEARTLARTSEWLASRLSATRQALAAGLFSWRHAEKIVEHALGIPVEALGDYESQLLAKAATVTAGRLGRLARIAVEEVQPSTAIERALAASQKRWATLDPAADGMACLTQYIPAVEAVAIMNRARALARSLKNAGDPRTLTQLISDVLTDLQINGESSIPGAPRAVAATVHITVPVLTFLGHDDEPPTLDGYGPIDPATAAGLVGRAKSFIRVLTDAMTGQILSYGRRRYTPGADLDDHVRFVFATCGFVGCESAARDCDLDHHQDFGGPVGEGQTEFDNLGPLCVRHHRVKHHTEWAIERQADGTQRWTSPAGFVYVVDNRRTMRRSPAFREAPAPPPPHAGDDPPPF